MRFMVPAALIAAPLMWIGALAAASAAAECGGAGRAPCATNRAAAKPAAPKPAAQTPPTPQHRTAPDPSAAAVDITLSKIPDIIVPEPAGETPPDEPAAEVQAWPWPPPQSAQPPSQPGYLRRHGPED